MPTFPIDGRIYLGTDGAHWFVCRRPFPDSPAQSANVDTGELRVFEDHHVAEWLNLRLTAVIRIIGGRTRV